MPRAERDRLRAFTLQERAVRALATLRPLRAQLRRHDPVLAEQLARAATQIAIEVLKAERADSPSRRLHLIAGLAATRETMTLLCLVAQLRGGGWETLRVPHVELGRMYEALLRRAAREPRRGKTGRQKRRRAA